MSVFDYSVLKILGDLKNMGFDEENLVPCPRRINKSKNLSENKNCYLLINEDEKRQIYVSSADELRNLVEQKYKIDDHHIEFWSEFYQDWILFEKELPDNNSKIRILPKNKKNCPELFVESLNSAFKSYLESDTGHNLENFETAVIFLLKRSRDKVDQQDNLAQSIQEHNVSLKNLSEEIKIFKASLKQFKSDIECLNEKISSTKLDENVDFKRAKNLGVFGTTLRNMRKNHKKSSL
ncbi:hypothetical protein BpHYR1_035221 [Brachionus plicatilis]|uniref:Uncharacterized protein n=1 Tax=Brachionus plicatilis TaxID=10195 RepID=A0A3M7T9N0_BRAPC|nr:hypothetical protein BpHYR1_035221 [Brachionus plicatilis]